jgi:PAS domain S-box-containing protein
VERNNRLLIIDDNRAIHDDFRKILNSARTLSNSHDEAKEALFGEASGKDFTCADSFQLDSAYQGESGLGLVQEAVKQGRPYAMAFVDVRMPPGWDGVETIQKIWEVDPDLQVVICSAHSVYPWNETMTKIGHSDRLLILKKPFDAVEVLQLACAMTEKWWLLQETKRSLHALEDRVRERTSELTAEITERKGREAALREAEAKIRGVFDQTFQFIGLMTLDGVLIEANETALQLANVEKSAVLGKPFWETPWWTHSREMQERLRAAVKEVAGGKAVRFEATHPTGDGTLHHIDFSLRPLRDQAGNVKYLIPEGHDITERKQAEQERAALEVQLRQAQKLEAIGQLAAGIAHEINTPIQYIGDNIHFIEESFNALAGLLQEYQRLAAAVRSNTVTPEVLSAVESSIQKADLDYLSKEIPLAVQQSLQGVGHVSRIVNAMKEFSHPGSTEKEALDLNHAIEMTVTVARNEWKYVAEMVTDFAPALPPVPCLPGEFNQVILNLIINASHAIGDVVRQVEGSKGTIRISTRLDGAWVEIRISDTGTGVPEEIRHRIFDPFFTTKGVGKGTGQGLAIARSVIVDKHGGTLTFESEMGRGTTFIIRLPVTDSAGAGKEA